MAVAPSVYEQFQTTAVVSEQRFVEHFSGDTLCSDRWACNQINLTTTVSMNDCIGRGFQTNQGASGVIIHSISTGDTSRHFAPRCSTFILVAQRVCASGVMNAGFGNRACGDLGNTPDESMFIQNSQAQACFRIVTTRSSTSATVLGTASNNNFNLEKAELTACAAQGTINGGCVCACHTTNLPLCSSKLYLGFKSVTTCAAAVNRVRYMEAYNQ